MRNIRKITGCIVFTGISICGFSQEGPGSAEQESFRVFPNPSYSGEAVVSISGFSASNLLVVVYDMLGREIYSKVELVEKDGFLFTLSSNGHRLPSGVYLITAAANDKVFREKLIVR